MEDLFADADFLPVLNFSRALLFIGVFGAVLVLVDTFGVLGGAGFGAFLNVFLGVLGTAPVTLATFLLFSAFSSLVVDVFLVFGLSVCSFAFGPLLENNFTLSKETKVVSLNQLKDLQYNPFKCNAVTGWSETFPSEAS